MHNYYADLVWRIDKVLLLAILLLALLIIGYLFIQEFALRLRRRRLLRIKSNIYELLLSKKDKNVCLMSGSQNLTPEEFLDVVTNRSRWAVFFNEAEQDYFRNCFITQHNISKIEKIARRGRNKWRRIEAMLALSYAGASCALAVFERGLFNKDPDISYFSLLALGRIKTEMSLKILLAFLSKDALRRRKVAAIVENFPPYAADEIIKLTQSQDPEVRFWALKILSRFKPVKYTAAIRGLAKDSCPNVRAAACECLGNIGGKEAEAVLSERLRDDAWLVRANAAKALSQAMGDDCVKHIAGLLNDSSLNVVEAVKEILARHIDSAFPYLEKIIAGEEELAGKMAGEILATGGYTGRILKEAAAKEGVAHSREMKLLAALIKSGARHSIEQAFSALTEQERRKVLEKIRQVDEKFSEDISRNQEGLAKEI